MSNHDEFDELAVGYALDALEPDDEQAFLAHLRGCAICQATVADMRAVAAELAADVPHVRPPDGLRAAILGNLPPSGRSPVSARDEQQRGGDEPVAGPSRVVAAAGRRPSRGRGIPRQAVRSRVLAVMTSLVLVLAVGGGFATWGIGQSHRASDRQTALNRSNQIVAEQDAVLAQIARPGSKTVALPATSQAGGAVVITGDQMYLVTSGLAPNDATRSTYVLWAITGAGKVDGLRAFDVGSSVSVVNVGRVGSDVARSADFKVSREPGRVVPATPTAIVLG